MTPFYIGWSTASARPLRGFLASLLALLLLASATLALALGVTADDPGGGDVVGDKTIVGVLIADPYPMIVADRDGHTIPLSGGGKRGVQDQARPLDGRRVRASGTVVRRGDRDLLLVADLAPEPGEARPPPRESLGFWRLTGEICDGKCVSGVMRPGNGAAHKACANICLIGGVPPILVTTTPVLGTRHVLMGDPDNRALPDAFRDHVAVARRLDGALERIGDALLFRTDVARAVAP